MGDFSKNDICGIIKACSEHGVKSFELENLKIAFKTDYEHDFAAPMPEQKKPPLLGVELTDEQKQDIYLAQRQELMTADPLAFEQMLLDESNAYREEQ